MRITFQFSQLTRISTFNTGVFSQTLLWLLGTGILLFLSACSNIVRTPESATAVGTPALISCDEITQVANHDSILPPFTPSSSCELENTRNHVDTCMVTASAELSYPCSQTESSQEIIISEGTKSLLIQRDYHFSAGCWHGVTDSERSLRVCDKASGQSTTFAADVLGDPLLNAEGTGLAFVATEPGSHHLKPHIFRVGKDGTDLIQLDTHPFPQDQVVGAQIMHWSEDGEWLEISLWDGSADGHNTYRLRTDGSGQFELLP